MEWFVDSNFLRENEVSSSIACSKTVILASCLFLPVFEWWCRIRACRSSNIQSLFHIFLAPATLTNLSTRQKGCRKMYSLGRRVTACSRSVARRLAHVRVGLDALVVHPEEAFVLLGGELELEFRELILLRIGVVELLLVLLFLLLLLSQRPVENLCWNYNASAVVGSFFIFCRLRAARNCKSGARLTVDTHRHTGVGPTTGSCPESGWSGWLTIASSCSQHICKDKRDS